ncbi:hypothetical protein [Pseudoduganella lutea]|nr:hypothetical protein [Pseudoduganella lutea]
MKDQNRYLRPTAEQWEAMKQLRRDSKRAGMFRLDLRARLVEQK